MALSLDLSILSHHLVAFVWLFAIALTTFLVFSPQVSRSRLLYLTITSAAACLSVSGFFLFDFFYFHEAIDRFFKISCAYGYGISPYVPLIINFFEAFGLISVITMLGMAHELSKRNWSILTKVTLVWVIYGLIIFYMFPQLLKLFFNFKTPYTVQDYSRDFVRLSFVPFSSKIIMDFLQKN